MQTLPATPFPFEVFDGVTYIQLVAVKACTLQGLIQNLPGWPDKNTASQILVVARLLAQQHHAGCCRAFSRHGLRRVFP